MAVDTDRVRTRLTRDHQETLDGVADCADATVASWSDAEVTDAAKITESLESCLKETGTLKDLLAVLRTGVAATDRTLAADPVPAPPYLTISSRGPVLRGPVSMGRLVITIGVFDVRDGTPPVYRRTEDPYRVSVEWLPERESR